MEIDEPIPLINLTKSEIDFINLIGKTLSSIGNSVNMRRLFALFMLRGLDIDQGLDQEEIVKLFEPLDKKISISTVSRTLKSMDRLGYIGYKVILVEERARRKYFLKAKIKNIALDKIKSGLTESQILTESLRSIKEGIGKGDIPVEDVMLSDQIEHVIAVYQTVLEIYNDVLNKADDLFY